MDDMTNKSGSSVSRRVARGFFGQTLAQTNRPDGGRQSLSRREETTNSPAPNLRRRCVRDQGDSAFTGRGCREPSRRMAFPREQDSLGDSHPTKGKINGRGTTDDDQEVRVKLLLRMERVSRREVVAQECEREIVGRSHAPHWGACLQPIRKTVRRSLRSGLRWRTRREGDGFVDGVWRCPILW